jgi:hypothetical protein
MITSPVGTNSPGFALEVAYPQKATELEELAGFYLFEASPYARKVVGICIDEDPSRKVTLDTWKRDTATGGLRHSSQVSISATNYLRDARILILRARLEKRSNCR